MLLLWPLACFGAVLWLRRSAERDHQRWLNDPARPWNVQARLAREAFEFQRDTFSAHS